MVNIKGFPLLHEEDCKRLFSADAFYTHLFFLKPIYKSLPDFTEFDDEEKEDYIFKNLKQGDYLVGLDVISDKWVNKGFCAMLLEKYGLVLDESTPMVKKADYYEGWQKEESFVYLSFQHIAYSVCPPLLVSVSENDL